MPFPTSLTYHLRTLGWDLSDPTSPTAEWTNLTDEVQVTEIRFSHAQHSQIKIVEPDVRHDGTTTLELNSYVELHDILVEIGSGSDRVFYGWVVKINYGGVQKEGVGRSYGGS